MVNSGVIKKREKEKNTQRLSIQNKVAPKIMADLHSLPAGTWPSTAIRNNGPDHLVLERAKLRELAEGWPCYR
jgi:hypothetical protein